MTEKEVRNTYLVSYTIPQYSGLSSVFLETGGQIVCEFIKDKTNFKTPNCRVFDVFHQDNYLICKWENEKVSEKNIEVQIELLAKFSSHDQICVEIPYDNIMGELKVELRTVNGLAGLAQNTFRVC